MARGKRKRSTEAMASSPLAQPASSDIVTMDKLTALCKRRGFVFPSSDIYGGLGSAYDYGHYGVLTKNNIKSQWLDTLIRERDDIMAIDSAIILHPKVWEASGHVQNFADPLVDCRVCKKRFRADDLKNCECGKKASKYPGEEAVCDLTKARQFNLMFETSIGPVQDSGAKAYLRPETAQGIFINFKNALQTSSLRPPFGIAQIGKSFRNEITPSNFLFRTREFEQMELEFFVPPQDVEKWYQYWLKERENWYLSLGIRKSHLRLRHHSQAELAHYSKATADVEYLFPIGWSELEGIADRGDFDLTSHAAASGAKLEYVAPDGTRYVPCVIEPSAGADRAMLAFLTDAYDEEEVKGETRTVLRLHPRLAPIKAVILPVVGRDADLVSKGKSLYQELRGQFAVEYDDSGFIGRRYRRHDEIGTPWAVTLDSQTLEDDTVTVRDRDSLEQIRIPLGNVASYLEAALKAPWTTPKGD